MLKKLIISLTLISIVTFSLPSFANSAKENYDPLFALADVVVLRPLGLAVTIAGSALFVGISPLTALANIAPPHDAFRKTAYALVMTPVDFTFKRPVGVDEWSGLSSPPELQKQR